VRRRPPVLALVLPLLVTGCSASGGDDAGSGTAEAALRGQRDAVEQTARGLVAAGHDVLGGGVLESRGRWEGCHSRFPEGYEDFRYTADVRLEAGPGTPDDLEAALRTIADQSGYAVGVVDPDPDVPVRVTDGDVSASLADVPDLGAEGDVLIRLAAEPCVEVPGDEWSEWMGRDDPGPDVG
jgi:hypothetical protein